MRAREKFERKDSLENSVPFGSAFCVKKPSIDFFSDKYNLRKVKRLGLLMVFHGLCGLV